MTNNSSKWRVVKKRGLWVVRQPGGNQALTTIGACWPWTKIGAGALVWTR